MMGFIVPRLEFKIIYFIHPVPGTHRELFVQLPVSLEYALMMLFLDILVKTPLLIIRQ